MDGCIENVIEFIKDSPEAYITFSQRRYISKLERLEKEHPGECIILNRNNDGSIYAKVPTSWVKVAPPRKVSDEQRQRARECFRTSTRTE